MAHPMENRITDAPHLVEVIRTRIECRGSGKDHTSPCRRIDQFFDRAGNLLMEHDPSALVLTPELAAQMINLMEAAKTQQVNAEHFAHVIVEFLDGHGLKLLP